MKILTLISSGLNRPDINKLLQEEAADRMPRISLYQRELNSDMLDERFLQTIPKWRKIIYKFLPIVLQQVIEAYIICHKYDLVVTWAERLAYPFAFLLKITNRRVPHITLNSWISNPKKSKFLKLTISHIDKILLWSSVQKNFALNHLKIPESKIEFIRKFADQKFFRPIERETDLICAVGSEMRDYPTLVEALRGTDIPCHIAAGLTRGKLYNTVKALYDIKELPPNITIGPKYYYELRELYARSRFVVVPILPTDTDNGLTCILESMAMGKAVICSRTVGQVDVIQDGITGIYVPVQDPLALREAIIYLWNNPEIAKKMGLAGRRYLEEHHTFEQFIESMRTIIEKVIMEHKQRKNNL
ncbi:MAG: glycosyl transferase group 1 [Ignavibacteriae bacterium]|nr:MAG: glycosyl transferase group 1 [Ignavibacteriota bacterium]